MINRWPVEECMNILQNKAPWYRPDQAEDRQKTRKSRA